MRIRFDPLRSLFVPPRCMICARGCASDRSACADCSSDLERAELGSPRRLAGSKLDGLHAAYEFEGVARAAVHTLKFGGRVALADVMGELLARRAPSSIDFASCTIVPVPSHPKSRRRRGFDQAHLLARALSDATGAPVVDLLVRRGLRGTQTGLGRTERLAVPVGEFGVRERDSRHHGADPLAQFPTNVVVCDDVATTTCTLEACASAIRERCDVQTLHGLTFASASASRR